LSRPDAVVLDVGGWIGTTAVWLAAVARKALESWLCLGIHVINLFFGSQYLLVKFNIAMDNSPYIVDLPGFTY
jgi:hypothetical protein